MFLLSSWPRRLFKSSFPLIFFIIKVRCVCSPSRFVIDINDTHIWQSLTTAKMYQHRLNYFLRMLFEEFRYKPKFFEIHFVLSIIF